MFPLKNALKNHDHQYVGGSRYLWMNNCKLSRHLPYSDRFEVSESGVAFSLYIH